MTTNELVSVVIPSYNRFKFLTNAISSVLNQTYQNFEIIVVNDGSTEKEYYSSSFSDKVKVLNLKNNQRDILGYVSNEYVRNIGIQEAKGKYLAFLDDDDVWMPKKLEIQIEGMRKNDSKFSSTEGLYGEGPYVEESDYQLYNNEKFYSVIKKKYSRTKFSPNVLEKIKGYKFEYPEFWTYDFLEVHNCIITSSVIVEKKFCFQDTVKFLRINFSNIFFKLFSTLDNLICNNLSENKFILLSMILSLLIFIFA